MKLREDQRVSNSLFSIKNYIQFFLLISGLVTCCFLLFLDSVDLEYEVVHDAAIKTFGNVLFLSLLCTLIDGIRRFYTVKKPVTKILKATQQLTQGNFDARIEPLHKFGAMNEFDAIIEDFNKMAAELAGIETLRVDFIANVSHELKTPLAIIQNYATMLQNPEIPTAKRIEYAQTITNASRRLSDLITNILKLNKLENQQIYPDVKVYDLGEQLCQCLLNFESEWEKKQLELDTEIEDEVMIKADAELMTLVWNNLFSNAVKFSEPGGKISVRLKMDEDTIQVRISDSGCGFSAEVGAHIFEKFYQGDSSHAVQGNGLGLALVKRVIDIMGGEISVESVLNQGSTFIVKLSRDKL